MAQDSNDPRHAFSLIDRQIDDLGREDRIKSEEDARGLVDAIVGKVGAGAPISFDMGALKLRLTKAEYEAVLNPEKRIPETLVTTAFNHLMERLAAPAFTKVSVDELHAFRVARCLTLYPNWLVRQPDGNLPTTLRPVEAVYLIYLLYLNGGVSLGLRQAISVGGLPPMEPIAAPVADFGLRAVRLDPAEFQRRQEYGLAISKFAASHSGSTQGTVLLDIFELVRIK